MNYYPSYQMLEALQADRLREAHQKRLLRDDLALVIDEPLIDGAEDLSRRQSPRSQTRARWALGWFGRHASGQAGS